MEGPIRRADRETASHDTTPLLFSATTAVRAFSQLLSSRPSSSSSTRTPFFCRPARPLPFHFRDRPLLSPLRLLRSILVLSLSFLLVSRSTSPATSSTRCAGFTYSRCVSSLSISFFLIDCRCLCQSDAPRCSLIKLSRFTGRSSEARSQPKPPLARESRETRGWRDARAKQGEPARCGARVGEFARYRRRSDAIVNPYSGMVRSIHWLSRAHHAAPACGNTQDVWTPALNFNSASSNSPRAFGFR